MAAVPVYLSILFAIAFANVIVQGDGPENAAAQPEIAIVTGPHHVTVEKKFPLLLNCSVVTSKTFGPVEYTWTKNGLPLVPQLVDRRIHIFQNGSLYFRRIIHRKRRENRLSDEGLYECVAGNKNGSVVARRVHVEIAGIARNFTQEPSAVVTFVGSSARFDCSIKATPPATIVWQRDNVQLTIDDQRFVQLPSGALQIHDVSMGDQGSYRCMAAQNFNHLPDEVTNIKWKWSQQARLTVMPRSGSERDMHLLAAPQNTTAMSGETVILECLVDGSPLPSIEWRRKDRRALTERHQSFGGNNLLISNVQSEDAGVYQCVVSGGELRQYHEATLYVHTYPVMITDPESNEWDATRTISLFCEVDGTPMPTIMWYFNGVPLHKLEKGTMKYELREENTRLIVYTIRLENSGYYQCIAENTIGQVFAIARIFVFIHELAPSPPETVTITPMSSSVLTVEWTQTEMDKQILAFLLTHRLKDHDSLDEVQETVVGSMRSYNLTGLLPFTTYVITIRTFSKKGSSFPYSVEGRTLEGVPLAVPTFQVGSQSANSMLVTWEELPAKDRGGIITQYMLQYRALAKPAAITTRSVNNADQRSLKITGLKPDTEYEIRLAAGTKNGFPDDLGGWSRHTTPTFNPNLMSTPQLKVDVLNTTSVLLQWERLEVPATAGYNIHAVQLRQLDKDTVLLHTVLDPPAHSYILTQLENNTEYEVTVYANQKQIEVTHTFRISEGLLVPMASKLRSRVINPTSVRLEWSPSFKHGDIVKYQVCYKKVDSAADLTDQCIDSERPYAVISDLQPFTLYQFGVRIITDQRLGTFTKLETETSEDKPGPPVNLTYEVLKQGSVRLHWSPPSQPNGVITSYIIFYNQNSDVPDTLWTNLTKLGQQRIAQVDGLDTQQYFFKLSACNKAGLGHPSKVVMVYPDCLPTSQCPPSLVAKADGLTDKQVGILIGVVIGIACIIICVIVILCRHRCFRVNSRNNEAISSHYHGNNHLPICHSNGYVPGSHNHGNGHARTPLGTTEHPVGTAAEITALETMPMLMRLPENEHSDAKGGGDMIVTPNGVRVNGLVKVNGHLPNGVPPITLDLSSTSEERRGLIDAMLAATNGLPHQQATTSNTEPDHDSLTGIDQCESADENPLASSEKSTTGSFIEYPSEIVNHGSAASSQGAPFREKEGDRGGGNVETMSESSGHNKRGQVETNMGGDGSGRDSKEKDGDSNSEKQKPHSVRNVSSSGRTLTSLDDSSPTSVSSPTTPTSPTSPTSPPSTAPVSPLSPTSPSPSSSSQRLRKKTASSLQQPPATSQLRSPGHRYLDNSLPPPPPPPPLPSPPPSPPLQRSDSNLDGRERREGERSERCGEGGGEEEKCREEVVSFAPRPSLPQSSLSSSSSHQAAAESLMTTASTTTAAAKPAAERKEENENMTMASSLSSLSPSAQIVSPHSHPVC